MIPLPLYSLSTDVSTLILWMVILHLFDSHSTDDSTPILWICNWELLSFYWWFYIYSNDDLIPILLTVFYFHSTDHSECLKASEKSSQWWNGFCWWLALQTSAEKFAMPPSHFPKETLGIVVKAGLSILKWCCFIYHSDNALAISSKHVHLPACIFLCGFKAFHNTWLLCSLISPHIALVCEYTTMQWLFQTKSME